MAGRADRGFGLGDRSGILYFRKFRVGVPLGKFGSGYGCSVHLAATTGIATGAVSQSKSRIENLNQRRAGLERRACAHL